MKKSQLKIGAALSYVIVITQTVIQLFYTPVMLRILGQSEYGIYTLVASFVSYLSLLSLGMNGAYLRFYSRFKAKDEKTEILRLNGMFLTIFLILGVVAAAAGIVMTFFSDQIFGDRLTPSELHTAKILMAILVFNIALSFPTTVFDSIITSHEAFLFQRVVTLLSVIANPFIALPLLLLGYKSIAMVSVTTGLSLLRLIVDIYYCKKHLKAGFIFNHFNFSLIREISVFSFFIFLNMIIDQVNWNLDKFILGRVQGAVAIAIYGVGAQFNTLVTSFSSSISSVFAPRVNMMVANHESDSVITNLFIRTGRIQFIILALVNSGFIFFGQYFIKVWAGNGYEEAYAVALLLILPAIVPFIQNIGIEIQRAKNKHQFRSVAYLIMAVLNGIISIPLAMWYGPIGSALGTGVSILVGNGIIMNWYYHKHLGINIFEFWKSIAKFVPSLIFPSIVGVLILRFIKYQNFAVFMGFILLYCVVFAASFWFFGMNDYEKNLIRESAIAKKLKAKFN